MNISCTCSNLFGKPSEGVVSCNPCKINIWMLHNKIHRYQNLFSGNILDIGARSKPYRNLFTEVAQYVGTNTCRHHQINHLRPDEDTTDVWIGDGTALPFQNATFDGVVFKSSL